MKKFSLILTVVFFPFIFVSCSDSSGARSDPAPQEEEEKSIFGIWTSIDRSFTLDSSGGSFDTTINVIFRETSGEVCICRDIFSGTESSGTINELSCTYAGGGSGDPGCADDLGIYTYTKAGGTLEVCDSRVRCQAFF